MNIRSYFFGIASLVFIFDQLTKLVVLSVLSFHRSIPVNKGFLYLSLVNNKGAAFGILAGQRLALIAFGLFVSALVIYFHFKLPKDKLFLHTSLALILGGSLGNIFDRVFRVGAVVDFIDFRFWPAFNVADISVNAGIAIMILCILLKKEII